LPLDTLLDQVFGHISWRRGVQSGMQKWLSRVRWRYMLPVAMVTVSAYLMMFAATQNWRLGGAGSGLFPPATTINFILNGPSYFVFRNVRLPDNIQECLGYEGGALFGVAIFWFLIGRALDRRIAGVVLAESYPRFTVCLWLVSAIALGGITAYGVLHSNWVSDPGLAWQATTRLPLYSRFTVEAIFLLWISGLTGYFAWKCFDAAKRLRRKA
jgi:hypothetical protein